MLKVFQILLIAVIFFAQFSILSAAERSDSNTITLKKPPEVLGKWYKPENKRQVWLHTMFRLRREILAMNDYSQQGKQQGLEKWSAKFIKDYKSIATMVPQWQKHLYLDKLAQLDNAVKQQNHTAIKPLLKKIGKSCMHCHDDYQTVATLMYRSPDFDGREISAGFSGEQITYDELMENLSDSVNRLNIAIKDGYLVEAKAFIEPIEQQLEHMASSCGDCHQQDEVPVQRIMGAAQTLLPELAEQLDLSRQKSAGAKLGEFAVKVCAKCHSIHRLSSDLNTLFN